MTTDTEPPPLDIEAMAREAGFVEYELDDGTTAGFDRRYARFAELLADRLASIPERESVAEGLSQEVRDALCEVGVAIRAALG